MVPKRPTAVPASRRGMFPATDKVETRRIARSIWRLSFRPNLWGKLTSSDPARLQSSPRLKFVCTSRAARCWGILVDTETVHPAEWLVEQALAGCCLHQLSNACRPVGLGYASTFLSRVSFEGRYWNPTAFKGIRMPSEARICIPELQLLEANPISSGQPLPPHVLEGQVP